MIKIPSSVIEEIYAQARQELPNECCGLLTGTDNTVARRYPMTNVDRSPEHFSFDPRQHFEVLRSARKDGQKIIANYHSHPSTPARPSGEDLVLAFDPEIIYLIVSLAGENPDIKAFRIRNCQSETVEIIIV